MNPNVIEVEAARFAEAVLERSRAVPVVVDFWAPWCAPCRQLGPILEELAARDGGAWILAKVNVDENPSLSTMFSIRGIPQVIAFVDGRPASQFTGALPRKDVEAFLRALVPSDADRTLERMLAAARDGNVDEALELRARALEAGANVDTMPGDDVLAPFAAWKARMAGRGGLEALRARAADDPGDVASRYDLGCTLALSGAFEEALGEFLEVVRRDRAFEDDAGRIAMIAVFRLLGDAHPLTTTYRTLLSRELF